MTTGHLERRAADRSDGPHLKERVVLISGPVVPPVQGLPGRSGRMGRAGAGLWAAHMRHGAALALEPTHRLCQRQELCHSWGDLARIIVLLRQSQAAKSHERSARTTFQNSSSVGAEVKVSQGEQR